MDTVDPSVDRASLRAALDVANAHYEAENALWCVALEERSAASQAVEKALDACALAVENARLAVRRHQLAQMREHNLFVRVDHALTDAGNAHIALHRASPLWRELEVLVSAEYAALAAGAEERDTAHRALEAWLRGLPGLAADEVAQQYITDRMVDIVAMVEWLDGEDGTYDPFRRDAPYTAVEEWVVERLNLDAAPTEPPTDDQTNAG